METRTCGCGRWQLNGIPCPYVVFAIYRNRHYLEDYISKLYLMKMYRLSYAPSINPMSAPNEWLVDHDGNPIEPSIPKKQRRRPRKIRKRGADEIELVESVWVTRKGYDVCCGNCGKKGHNARSCQQPENPNRKKYPKRVRKSKPTYVSFFLFFYFSLCH
jgi:hypothetical protein